MKITQIVGLVNVKLAGETLTYTQMVSYLDDTINDINANLNACFPTFSQLYPTLITDAEYNAFPEQYITSVVVIGAALKFYTTDEEGISVAVSYQQEYERGLFYMVRDYSASVPEQYQAVNRGYIEGAAPSGVVNASHLNEHSYPLLNPDLRYVEGLPGRVGPPGKDGESAYTIALRNGFVGSESAWLESLTGPEGATGPRGEKGDKGNKGDKGDKGEPGYTPQRGTNYWTEEDIAEIRSYVDAAILGGEW